MGTLTIRNIEDPLKSRLRIRAAEQNRSMEEEARQILRAALQEPGGGSPDLATRVRQRFAGLGDVQLPIDPREPVRPPPDGARQVMERAAAIRKPKAGQGRR